jgi:hypothetical protein
MTIPKPTDILIGLAIVFGIGVAAMRNQTMLAVSLLCIMTIVVELQIEQFHAREVPPFP